MVEHPNMLILFFKWVYSHICINEEAARKEISELVKELKEANDKFSEAIRDRDDTSDKLIERVRAIDKDNEELRDIIMVIIMFYDSFKDEMHVKFNLIQMRKMKGTGKKFWKKIN